MRMHNFNENKKLKSNDDIQAQKNYVICYCGEETIKKTNFTIFIWLQWLGERSLFKHINLGT